jgi:hypothetical protein
MAALGRYVICFRVIAGMVRTERVLRGASNLPLVLELNEPGTFIRKCSVAAKNSRRFTSDSSDPVKVIPVCGGKSNMTPISLLLLD